MHTTKLAQTHLVALFLLASPAIARPAAAEPAAGTLVVCAPGYPGSTAEAQPVMDALTAALADAASWAKGDLGAIYFETEAGGVEGLKKPDVALAIVPPAFYFEHGEALKLTPKMTVVQQGGSAMVTWALVAKKGRVTSAASLDKWQLVSLVGYSPRFIRGPLLGSWGKLPDSVRITMSGQVLSALRKAASGEDVALLLDPDAVRSMASLPFAADLEVVTQSASLPQGLLCTVGKRLSADRWKALAAALPKLRERPAAAAALDGCRLKGFEPLDEKALAVARRIFVATGEKAQ